MASVQRGCEMTREDAKKVVVYAYQELPLPKFLEVIDEIYDDFEEELKKAYIEGGNDAWKALNCKELAK